MNEIGGMTGIDAEVYILDRKWSRQEGLIDKRIFTIVAGTGAGKSTYMVYGLYKKMLLRRRGKKSILCTQPRVSLAMTQPYNVAHLFKDIHIGEEIGYVTGTGGKVFAREDKTIIYCTTRILENYILSLDPESFGSRYPIIVIDEAHDQSIEMLTALRTVQQFVIKFFNKPWCPLFIIASATIDPLAYVSYFKADPASPYNSAFVAGKSDYSLEERYLSSDQIEKAEGDSVTLAVEETRKIVEAIIKPTEKPMTHTDILVFWTSGKEINRFFVALKSELESKLGQYLLSSPVSSSFATVEEAEPLPLSLAASSTPSSVSTSSKGNTKRNEVPPIAEDDALSKTIEESPKGKGGKDGSKGKEESGKGDKGDEKKIGERAKERAEERTEEKWHVLYLPYTRLEVTNRAESYELTYREHRQHEIKIVGATNTIEVGATLSNLYAVIDCARQLTRISFPLMGREVMMSIPISEISRVQRRGRAGRTGNGIYIGLYDQDAKDHLMPTSPPSTLIGTSIPSSIYSMLTSKTLAQFKETSGDPLVVGKLLGLKRIGCKLPITDIIKHIQLLTPISMDSSIHVISKLISLGLVGWDGSLTMLGLQVMTYRNMSLGEAFLRAKLTSELIHPVEIELFCRTVSESVSRVEVSLDIDWKPVITRFYPKASFTFKDKPPVREDVIGAFRSILSCFDKVTTGSLDFSIPHHQKWGRFDYGEAKEVIYAALDAYPLRAIDGAFYAPLFSDSDEVGKSRIIAICTQALRETMDRVSGRKIDLPTEEGEVVVIS